MNQIIKRKYDLITGIRLLIKYKNDFPMRDICIMRTSMIDHYIVHFDNYEDMEKYIFLINEICEYQMIDETDYIILYYILDILGKILYNQYDVLLYKKLIAKNIKNNFVIDEDIRSIILSDLPAEEVITVIRFSE